MTFFQKNIFVKRKKGEEFVYEKRGICLGVYISKKSAQIKYLFCSLDDDKTVNLPISAIERIDEQGDYAKHYHISPLCHIQHRNAEKGKECKRRPLYSRSSFQTRIYQKKHYKCKRHCVYEH